MGALRGWYTNIKCKMKQLKEFFIPFKGLKQGKHTFEYKIDNSFFESFDYEDFNDVNVSVEVRLNKMSTMMELDMRASGVVNVNCDITMSLLIKKLMAIYIWLSNLETNLMTKMMKF